LYLGFLCGSNCCSSSAHASYAAAGPVNRTDGDANNDQTHHAQQRFSALLLSARLPLPPSTARRRVPYLANLVKWVFPKARRSRPTSLTLFREFRGTSLRLELAALAAQHAPLHMPANDSRLPGKPVASPQQERSKTLTKLQACRVPMMLMFGPSMADTCVGHLARRSGCFCVGQKVTSRG
jgi:hypothetical protein